MSARPTHDSNGALLPAILCLHGGGSNATVFKIQARRLLWNLDKQFRFVFVQAPIEGTPGFGMLPVFASCAPFYRWVNRRFQAGESDVEVTPRGEVEAVDRVIVAAMEANGGVDSFRGLVGFSQGARLVAGLLLRQKIEERDLGASRWKFAFGVMIGGPFPPIAFPLAKTTNTDTETGADTATATSPTTTTTEEQDDGTVKVADYELLKQVPTVHAWGREDHVREGCLVLARACDSDHCFQMDFAGGHHLPLKDVEAKDLCDLIMAAWYAGGGSFGIAADETY